MPTYDEWKSRTPDDYWGEPDERPTFDPHHEYPCERCGEVMLLDDIVAGLCPACEQETRDDEGP